MDESFEDIEIRKSWSDLKERAIFFSSSSEIELAVLRSEEIKGDWITHQISLKLNKDFSLMHKAHGDL